MMRPEVCCSLVSCFLLGMLCTGHSSDGGSCSLDGMSISRGDYSLSDGTKVGSELMFHCPEGYYPSSSHVYKCDRRGRWYPRPSKEGYQCKLMSCPNPRVLQNGQVSPLQAKYTMGSQTTYTCSDGYKLHGSASRVCQANGKWSGTTPICDRGSGHCPDPGVPAGGRRDGNSFGIGDKVTYGCSTGLFLLGSKVRMCHQNRGWDGTEPVCSSKSTYDTPEEVSMLFSSSLGNRLEISGLNYSGDIQEGKRIQMRQGGKLHIYIALDLSGSIGKDNFTLAKKCILSLIDKIGYFDVTPKYGILGFASEVQEIVDILQPGNIIRKIKNIRYPVKSNATGSNLVKPFEKIYEKMSFFKANSETEFKEIRHAIIMFTDGKANMGGSAAPAAAQIKSFVEQTHGKGWQDYLDVYVFGVGRDQNELEIDKLVSKKKNERHYYKLKSGLALEKLFEMIIDEGDSVGLCGLFRYHYDEGTASSERYRHPWVSEITVTPQNQNDVKKCLGALVTPRFVLTAAHCFVDPETDTIEVTIFEQDVNVARALIHPEYNVLKKTEKGVKEFYDYDVALLQLEKDVNISAQVRPVCVPCTKSSIRAVGLTEKDTCKDQEDFLLGNNLPEASFMSKFEDNFYEKEVTIKLGNERHDCVKDAQTAPGISDYKEAVTDNFLCTGGTERSVDKVSCKGDSGGALFMVKKRQIQVGVVSWGTADLCKAVKKPMPESTKTSRDFHINLFRIQTFLKRYLGEQNPPADYAPLEFID